MIAKDMAVTWDRELYNQIKVGKCSHKTLKALNPLLGHFSQ